MEPTFFDGDLVFYKECSKSRFNLKLGDIVIFKHPFKKINLIKRVTEIQEHGVKVTGDNKNFSDDSNLFGLINKKKLIGVVTSHISKESLNKIKDFFY